MKALNQISSETGNDRERVCESEDSVEITVQIVIINSVI